MPGLTATMAEIVEAIESCEPRAAGTISFESSQLSTPFKVDAAAAKAALGPLPETSLHAGVEQTLNTFRTGLERHWIVPPEN